MSPLAWAIFGAGLFVGSFLNVVILRLHEGRSYVTGRSACPHCGHTLSPLELLPVISWMALRGRCRSCKKPISLQYPAVELLTGAIFALLYLNAHIHTLGDVLILLMWLYIASSFIILAVYDLRWYLLPDKILLPVMIPAAAILISEAITTHSYMVVVKPIVAALVFGGAFYGIAAVSKGRWMGGGDIKLAFIMGLLLGMQKTALAAMLAFDTAAVVGLALILLRRKSRRDYIPFGPFLIAGTLIAYVYGAKIIGWYVSQTAL